MRSSAAGTERRPRPTPQRAIARTASDPTSARGVSTGQGSSPRGVRLPVYLRALLMTRTKLTDWVDWHDPYADPQSPLSQRLAVVQRHIRGCLNGCRSCASRVVSLCAGDGRDLLDVLGEQQRLREARVRLVELDPDLVASAETRAAAAELSWVEVICADAALTDVYAGAVPAELVLLCGVFGNISDADVQRTIEALPQFCADGATVVWTRHRRDPDLTAQIRDWFTAADFHEIAFDSPGPNAWSVGRHSFHGDPQPLSPGVRLFTFIR